MRKHIPHRYKELYDERANVTNRLINSDEAYIMKLIEELGEAEYKLHQLEKLYQKENIRDTWQFMKAWREVIEGAEKP
jgi:dsDNA-specific endonuclease/ATPase MutS2